MRISPITSVVIAVLVELLDAEPCVCFPPDLGSEAWCAVVLSVSVGLKKDQCFFRCQRNVPLSALAKFVEVSSRIDCVDILPKARMQSLTILLQRMVNCSGRSKGGRKRGRKIGIWSCACFIPFSWWVRWRYSCQEKNKPSVSVADEHKVVSFQVAKRQFSVFAGRKTNKVVSFGGLIKRESNFRRS